MDLDDLKEKVKANSEEKARERKRTHYKNNRDEILKKRQIYHKENAKKVSQKKTDYQQKYHYKVNEQKSDYYQRNKKEITEKRKIKEKETLLNETEKCEFCGNLFSEAGNLNKHIHSVHGWDSLMEHSRKKKLVDSTIENLENDKEVEDDSDFKLDKANKN